MPAVGQLGTHLRVAETQLQRFIGCTSRRAGLGSVVQALGNLRGAGLDQQFTNVVHDPTGKGDFRIDAGLFGQHPADPGNLKAFQPEPLEVETRPGLECTRDCRGHDQGAQGVEAQTHGGVFDT
ncbi:hypothetical protein ALP75_202035 [Pseudomonas syringae pv. actinidiae]|nr:hypothetical protein ALP75_202035 [Pseudomonas syringae pv. actinidiae]